ncbi:hypothetical protein QE152_g26265 [Popillia japonica]|uniref:Pre-C2HC domain-containing protein n=1 Tax=Popillia japonica TaxID=7064 RepID=A0AAW1JXU6_POPJA
MDSIQTLAGKTAKFIAEEDAKGRFDATSSTIRPIVAVMDGPSDGAVERKPGLADIFNVAITNRYGILADTPTVAESTRMVVVDAAPASLADTPTVAESTRMVVVDAAPASLAEDNTSSLMQSSRKVQKPPPVCFISRVQHYREFRAKLDNISHDYYQHFAGDKTFIYYRKLEDYKRFVKTYSGTLPFYTFTSRNERTYAYLIKGLHCEIEVQDVKDELVKLEIPVVGVEKFKNTKNPIFMITVPKSIAVKELYSKAKYLQITRVYYEPRVSKRKLIQCKCHAWGYATTNCHLNVVRCVKCAGRGDRGNDSQGVIVVSYIFH